MPAKNEPLAANVVMAHPEVKGKAVATRDAFEKVWKDRGWKIEEKEDPRAVAGAATAVVDNTEEN